MKNTINIRVFCFSGHFKSISHYLHVLVLAFSPISRITKLFYFNLLLPSENHNQNALKVEDLRYLLLETVPHYCKSFHLSMEVVC